MRTTAFADSNITAMFLEFGKRLDHIMDSGGLFFSELKAIKSNIGQMTQKICEYIELFHIGCWIIEEAEFLFFQRRLKKAFRTSSISFRKRGSFFFALRMTILRKPLQVTSVLNEDFLATQLT